MQTAATASLILLYFIYFWGVGWVRILHLSSQTGKKGLFDQKIFHINSAFIETYLAIRGRLGS